MDVPIVKLPNVIGACTSAIVGATIAYLIFPTPMLLGSHDYWDHAVGDVATGLTGFYEFAQDRWRWPLLYTPNLNSPEGASIFFTDPNGIFALIFKILFKITGILYPYIGLWIFISYVLNGVFGYLILKISGIPIISSVIGSSLFVLFPAFIQRTVHHHTLTGHFIILGSIYSYIRISKGYSRQFEIYIWSIFIGLSVLVTPYLFAMSAPIFFAALLDANRNKLIERRLALYSLSALIIVAITALSAAGAFDNGTTAAGGFRNYSMNLLSPIWPQFSSTIPNSSFLLATPGQYEGFNYLGEGIIFLVLVTIITAWRSILNGIYKFNAISIVLLGMFLFSLSSDIYLFNTKLISLNYDTLPIIRDITGIFRVPGRFFWPVAYFIVILSIITVARNVFPKLLPGLLLAVVLVQVADLLPLFQRVQRLAEVEKSDTQRQIAAILPDYTEVRFFPGYLCLKQREDRGVILSLQMVAALRGLPINGAYLNRGDPGCPVKEANFMADPFLGATTPKPLLILMKRSLPTGNSEGIWDARMRCEELELVYVCQRAINPPVSS